MTGASESARPRFEWGARPKIPRSATVLIKEALVPMHLWTSVPVVKCIDEELTIVDRFVLEAALSLAPMYARDVEEVTQIPEDAVTRIAGRLTGLGLLRSDGGAYWAEADAAYDALTKQSAPRYATAWLSFLYLPDGDDLVAFSAGPGQTAVPMLNRVAPISGKALASDVAGVPLTEFIGQRIRSGTVARLPEDIVDVVEEVTSADEHGNDDGPIHVQRVPDTCSVYRCAGHVKRQGDDVTLVLQIKGRAGNREKCVIPGAVGQANIWESIDVQVPDAVEDWDGRIAIEKITSASWRFILDEVAADSAAWRDVPISEPGGLSITELPSCIVEVEIEFEPEDSAAARIFALDHAVREVTETAYESITGSRNILARAAESGAARFAEYGPGGLPVTGKDVEERLWAGNHFRHVYAIREAEDFAYD